MHLPIQVSFRSSEKKIITKCSLNNSAGIHNLNKIGIFCYFFFLWLVGKGRSFFWTEMSRQWKELVLCLKTKKRKIVFLNISPTTFIAPNTSEAISSLHLFASIYYDLSNFIGPADFRSF